MERAFFRSLEKLIIQTPDTRHQLQDETLGAFYFLLSASSVNSVAMSDFAKQTWSAAKIPTGMPLGNFYPGTNSCNDRFCKTKPILRTHKMM
jgi:hypothetical protein